MHQLEFGAVTHRGTVRPLNEDSILAAPPIFVVADGIGGAAAGEEASALVVGEFSALEGHPLDSDLVAETLERCHQRVRALQLRAPGAGSTVCGAVGLQHGEHYYWLIFNLGDSRAFRIAGEPHARRMTQVSVDHSYVQELVEAGQLTREQAAVHPDRNLVTKAIGAPAWTDPDFWLIPMVPGDRMMFCSDGLVDAPMEDVRALLCGAGTAATTADQLLELALRSGARDNVSVIVVDVGAMETDEPTIRMAQAWR